MAQLAQMTRHITSWLGWMPPATFDSYEAKNLQDDDSLPQQSSGFLTVLAIYLAMALVLALSFYTARDKATKEPTPSKSKRKLAQQQPQQQQQQRSWRFSATGMALTNLIRQVSSAKRSRHQLRLRLRMRLRRHFEQELKLVRELKENEPLLRLLDDEASDSNYFDPSSEASEH